MRGLTNTLLVSNKPDYQMTELIKQVETLINKREILNTSEKEKLGDLFSQIVKWNDDNNDFEDYFQDFSQMMAAMCQSDFSKKLPVSGFKKNLLNFIALGLNAVNEELKETSIHKSFFHSLEGISPYGVIFTNVDFDIVDVNQKVLERLGYDKQQLTDSNMVNLLLCSEKDKEKLSACSDKESLFFCELRNSENETIRCKIAAKAVNNQTHHLGYSFIIFQFGEEPKFKYECPIPFCDFKSF